MSSRFGLDSSREIACLSPDDTSGLHSDTSDGASAVIQPVRTQGDNPLKSLDAFSGPDLDVLLTHSYQQALECLQPNSICFHCHLWQSIRFDDSEEIDELPTWFPHLRRSPRPPRRYQILPFFHANRWQLAVFDIEEYVLVCYDTMWTRGATGSTFLVSRAFAGIGLEIDINVKSLERWFDVTVGNAREKTFGYHHTKVS